MVQWLQITGNPGELELLFEGGVFEGPPREVGRVFEDLKKKQVRARKQRKQSICFWKRRVTGS